MTERPVVTAYPHDRLSRLADAMTDALGKIPGTGDVRGVVMIHDAESGCVHPHGYPEDAGRRNALMFLDIAVHLAETGRALGMTVELIVNGKKMPLAGPEASGG